MSLSFDAALQQFTNQYPIEEEWGAPEVFRERAHIAGLDLNLVGLASNGRGVQITGSSVGGSLSSLKRAYFEMVERASLQGVLQFESRPISLCGFGGEVIRESSRQELFPAVPMGCLWQYSVSNGVAAHLSFGEARDRALQELLERDAILRSWYSGKKPESLALPYSDIVSVLQDEFDVRVVRFASARSAVIGVFGFPKDLKKSAFFGFGTSNSLDKAIRKAFRESLQRLGFTWGEDPCVQEGNVFAEFKGRTAEDHLEFYLNPESTFILKDWLTGKLEERYSNQIVNVIDERVLYADLTPPQLRGRVWVLKAIYDECMPLTFGSAHPWVLPVSGTDRIPHPIA